MGFSVLTILKEKYRNILGEEHPMRLALSDVVFTILEIVEAKW